MGFAGVFLLIACVPAGDALMHTASRVILSSARHVFCRGASVTCLESEAQWRKASLEVTGQEYWWRESSSGELEISVDKPFDAWRVGMLPSGRPYTWRPSIDDPEDPEVRVWHLGVLSSGRRYWWTDDGDVSLSDPHDLACGYDEPRG